MNNPTATKAREELALLDLAQKMNCSGAHYDTVCDAIKRAGLPYELVQTDRNDIGEYLRGDHYRYFWRSRWDNGSALYISETDAGRRAAPCIKDAFSRLRKVLEEAAA